MKKYLLAHDLGTSGNKATLYSTDGQLIKSQVFQYDTHFFNGNWAEQDPDIWWRAVAETTKAILSGIDSKHILAVSFSGQMQGCICVDRSGVPLRPAIIWADQRAQKETEELTSLIGMERFYHITGHRPSPSYSLLKLMWIKNNEPDVYNKTYKMLLCKDYMLFKLTGRYVTDYSDASGTNALDLNTLQWSDEILEAVKIHRDKLPEIMDSTQIAGGVTAEVAWLTGLAEGTPVVVGGGDGACAAVGAGCIKAGDTYSCLGSSAWIALAANKPVYDKEMRTFNFAHLVPGLIMPCGTMQTGGASYSWLKNELGLYEAAEAKKMGISPYDLINQKAMEAPPGANGILFLPYLLGERSPRWNVNARGAFIGLKMENKREDIFRAVLEGVAFNLKTILDVFKTYQDIQEITLIGGGARGELWRQIMADVYDIPVLKPNYLEEATSMGAAIAAGIGAGVFSDFSVIKQFVKIESETWPIKEHNAIYRKIYPVFEQAYESLIDVYERLADL